MAATVLAAGILGGLPAVAGAAPLGNAVDTRMGTDEGAADFGTGGGAGATYPGAVAPFGMVQLSPDTDPSTANAAGGYSYPDSRIKGFSTTHISGAGCSGLGDVPLLPTTHAIDASPSLKDSFDVDPRYVASFTHRGEVARPGDYRVKLNPGAKPIGAELTARTRAAAMRLTFPTGSDGSVLVNAGGSSMGNTDAKLHVDPAKREISGTIGGGGFCYAAARYRIHFVAKFDQPFKASGTWQRTTLRPGSRDVSDKALVDQPLTGLWQLQYKRLAGGPPQQPGNPTKGALAGAYATFAKKTVVARVAISSVSVAGARANLAADATARFDAMRAAAKRAWEQRLSAIRVTGGQTTHRKLFYTSLYHAMVMPNVFSDIDGRYGGMDGRVHRAKGFVKYANISGWDTYRAQLPLMAMLAPKQTSDFASSMVADQRESGGLPKWSVREGQTNTMVGDPADLLIAGAWAYGARDFDGRGALKAMVDGATHERVSKNGGYVQRAGLADYQRLGYVGFEQNVNSGLQTIEPTKPWATSSTTLEYALADFGIARLASAVGDRNVCSTFAARSANWRNVFDPASGIMRPRLAADGSFVTSFPSTSDEGFAEGSASQYTWFVPQDVAGLSAALGGRAAALARLDAFFTELNAGVTSDHAFLGNEPTLHTPYLYDWLGAPARGQSVIRRAMLDLYRPTPGGFPGNDDGGAMSAWWVFAALGLHPSVPGTGVLTLGSPLFTRAQVRLAHGTLDIRAPRAAAGRPYVENVKFGGKPLTRTWITWDSIAKGKKTLDFALSADAKQTWGTAEAAAPPSYAPPQACGG